MNKASKCEKLSTEEQEKIKKLLSEGLSQESIGRELGYNQSTLGRYIKKYHLHPYDNLDLPELMKGLLVSSPSVFFIEVPIAKRAPLMHKLLSEYGETNNNYGIVAIEEVTTPNSGILIFSNNHNLQHELLALANK